MTTLNLTNLSTNDLKYLQDYILMEKIGDLFLEHFIEISIKDDFELNAEDEHLLQEIALFILRQAIKQNANIFMNLHQTTEGNQIKLIILHSIKNELIKRRMQELQERLKLKSNNIDKKLKI